MSTATSAAGTQDRDPGIGGSGKVVAGRLLTQVKHLLAGLPTAGPAQ